MRDYRLFRAIVFALAGVAALAFVLSSPPVEAQTSVFIGGSGSYTNLVQATNALELRSGTNEQAFYVYNTFTDASNYERLKVGWDAFNGIQIAAEAAGTGNANKEIKIVTGGNNLAFAPGSTTKWTMDNNGFLVSAGVAFASLGTPANGTMVYCSDCTFANPCAGAGTGALAKRLNGAWRCD